MVKTPPNCMNIRTAGAVGAMCMCSLTTVYPCIDLSGNEDYRAVVVEHCMSTPWLPMRIKELNRRKRVQHTGEHKDSD